MEPLSVGPAGGHQDERPSALEQVRPVAVRLVHKLRRRRISSFLGLLFIPGLVLGIFTYMLHYTANEPNPLGAPTLTEGFNSLAMYLSTVYMAQIFAELLIQDKQTNFKALLVSMGLRKRSYYGGMFLVMLALVLVPTLAAIVTSLVFQFKGMLVTRLWVVLIYLLFALHLVGYIYSFSTLITSTSFIVIFYAPIVLELFIHPLLSYAIRRLYNAQQGQLVPWLLFAASASPYESLKILGQSYSDCRNCDKAHEGSNSMSQPTYLIALAMCFWTTVAYAFGFWFEEICPWKTDSEVKSPLFCLKKAAKFPSNRQESLAQEPQSPGANSKYFEQRPVSMSDIGISCQSLTKIYNNVAVVSSLTFNVFRGETTLLLGHNGAGKTTLMNMILGKLCPDQGKVFIRKSESQYVESGSQDYGLGVCPQTSVLDEDLTVQQHLKLLYDIKTRSDKGARRRAIEENISDLRLNTHSHCYPSEISGGMKRKLSLGMALVGKSDILILDEPSSGLDPDSRVWIWDIIKRYRGTRTVLLSTQHMEEADYLGDRIAIMSKGAMICCGSSIFLNTTFNSGYKLRVDCLASKKKKVLEFVRGYFSSAKLSDPEQLETRSKDKNEIQDMVIELADVKEDSEKRLIDMLEHIENNSESLHIYSHGLKSSSIEDVMLKTSNFEMSGSSTNIPIESSGRLIDKLVTTQIDGNLNEASTLKAFLVKFAHIYTKSWKQALFNRIILPTFIMWLITRTSDFNQPVFNPTIMNALYVMHFIQLPTAERVSGFKTVQLSSGATRKTYWSSFLLVDLISVLINVILVNLFWAISFSGLYQYPILNIHLILTFAMLSFNIAHIFFSYVASFFFKDSKSCVGYFLVFHLLPAFVQFLSLVLLLIITLNASKSIYISYIFMTFYPCIAYEYILYGLQNGCTISSGSCTGNGEASILLGFGALLLQIVVYAALLFYFEFARLNLSNWSIFPSTRATKDQSPLRPLDEDVNEESNRTHQLVQEGFTDDYILVVDNLVKSYVRGVRVIDHLSFSVKRKECFGLLGVNGAGKSTTFAMVVADFKQDSGLICLNGRYNSSDIDLYRKSLGYDPQTEPDFALSPVQALTLMARLRMVKESSIPELVGTVLDLLEMSEHAHKKTENLSGGTKRKLALGMSFIGNPKLLALDEPTAGVDPVARRNIWSLLKSLRTRSDSSVLISSHAMEECEAICDRIAIMAKGRLRCIGSFLHLRTKFVNGCRVKIQFSHSEEQSHGAAQAIQSVTEEIASKLQSSLSCEVKVSDTNISSATLTVNSPDFKRSKILSVLRECRSRHQGISYVINDPSLEDIFIAIAREESDESDSTKAPVVEV